LCSRAENEFGPRGSCFREQGKQSLLGRRIHSRFCSSVVQNTSSGLKVSRLGAGRCSQDRRGSRGF
jgi:hypothetical protein